MNERVELKVYLFLVWFIWWLGGVVSLVMKVIIGLFVLFFCLIDKYLCFFLFNFLLFRNGNVCFFFKKDVLCLLFLLK